MSISSQSNAILPCPLCSSVIHGPPPRAMSETPMWFFAAMKTAREGKSFWIWTGCKHAERFSQGTVEDGMRSLTEAKWDVEARRLFEERTKDWPAHAKHTFGRTLGFIAEEGTTP